MKGKVALITGGAGYVGNAVAKALAAAGMSVAAVVRDLKQAEALRSVPGDVRAYQADLSHESDIESLIADVERTQGAPFAYIHAAGEAPERGAFVSVTLSGFRKQIEGNTISAFLFYKAAAVRLKQAGEGVLIGIGSAAAFPGKEGKGMGAYAVAKAAEHSILMLLREEAVPEVRVHAVIPGLMEGGMNAGLPKAFIDIARANAGGTLADADMVAGEVVRLIAATSSEAVIRVP